MSENNVGKINMEEKDNNEKKESETNNSEKREKKRKKIILLIATLVVVIVLAVGGAYYFFGGFEETAADDMEEELALVQAEPIYTDDLEKTVFLTGNVQPGDTFMVIPQLSGEVEEVYVEEGDRVKEGDLLMSIDDGDYRLQLEEAQSARDGAQAQLDEAEAGPRDAEVTEMETSLQMAKDQEEQMKKEFERIEILHDQGFVSDQELEQAEMQYKNAKEQAKAAEAAMDGLKEGAREEQIRALRSQVNQADVGVRLASRNLDRANVKSPGSGTVASIEVSESSMADSASPSLILIDTGVVTVNAGLPQTYINKVSAGQDVTVEIPSAREEPYKTTIHLIGDMPPENGRSYPLEIVLPNEDELLRAGMFSRVEVVVDSREDVIVVPRNAIIEEGDEQGVYVVQEGKKNTVEFRSIETGISQDGMLEVIDGLDKGERVITVGLGDIGPGDEVRLNN